MPFSIVFRLFLDVLAKAKRPGGKKDVKIVQEQSKLSLFTDDMIVCMEKSMRLYKENHWQVCWKWKYLGALTGRHSTW